MAVSFLLFPQQSMRRCTNRQRLRGVDPVLRFFIEPGHPFPTSTSLTAEKMCPCTQPIVSMTEQNIVKSPVLLPSYDRRSIPTILMLRVLRPLEVKLPLRALFVTLYQCPWLLLDRKDTDLDGRMKGINPVRTMMSTVSSSVFDMVYTFVHRPSC